MLDHATAKLLVLLVIACCRLRLTVWRGIGAAVVTLFVIGVAGPQIGSVSAFFFGIKSLPFGGW